MLTCLDFWLLGLKAEVTKEISTSEYERFICIQVLSLTKHWLYICIAMYYNNNKI